MSVRACHDGFVRQHNRDAGTGLDPILRARCGVWAWEQPVPSAIKKSRPIADRRRRNWRGTIVFI